MPQSVYGPAARSPRGRGAVRGAVPGASAAPPPTLDYMKKAIEILSNLSDAGAKGKDLAVDRLNVLGQMVKLRIAVLKK
jgi:hypothetical protein